MTPTIWKFSRGEWTKVPDLPSLLMLLPTIREWAKLMELDTKEK